MRIQEKPVSGFRFPGSGKSHLSIERIIFLSGRRLIVSEVCSLEAPSRLFGAQGYGTLFRKPETGNRKPETGNRKPETGNRYFPARVISHCVSMPTGRPEAL